MHSNGSHAEVPGDAGSEGCFTAAWASGQPPCTAVAIEKMGR